MTVVSNLKKSKQLRKIYVSLIVLLALAVPVFTGCGGDSGSNNNNNNNSQPAPQTYSVSFSTYGGTSVIAQSVQAGGVIPASPETTQTGHTFDGWYSSSSFSGSPVAFPYTPTGNITLHAKWTPLIYTVTFDSIGGSDVPSREVQHGGAILASPATAFPGYDFSGWYTSDDFSGSPEEFPYTITENITFYANWTAKMYTVSFNPAGGSYVADLTGLRDDVILTSPETTLSGYDFGGWYAASTFSGNPVIFPYTLTENITLYAKWTSKSEGEDVIWEGAVNRFEVIPYGDHRIAGAGDIRIASAGIDPDRIKYSYSYGGYDFYYIHLGVLANIPMFSFSTQGHSSQMPSDYTVTISDEIRNSISGSVSVNNEYAKSIIDEYSISNVTGHKLGLEISTKYKLWVFNGEIKGTAEFNWEQHVGNSRITGFEETTSLTSTEERVTESARTTMQSRTFYLSSEMPDGYYRYTMFASSDVYLYAIRDTETKDLVFYEFKEHVKPNFLVWNLDFSTDGTFGKRDASSFEFDVDLLSNLPPAGTVTVIFDKNNEDPDGSEAIPQSRMVNIGQRLGMAAMPSPPVRPDYQFIGWNIKEDGSGLPFTYDTVVTSGITVYARWQYAPEVVYSLTANANPAAGGAVSPPSFSNIFPGSWVNITASAADHYTFADWEVISGVATFDDDKSANTMVALSSDATIRANFAPNVYCLTVNQNLTAGGSVTQTSPQLCTNAGVPISITASAAAHYSFLNWEVISGVASVAGYTAQTTVTLSSDATIRANFQLLSYSLTIDKYPTPWGNVPNSQSVSALTPVSINATPNSGNKFVRWIVVSGLATIANPNAQNTTVTLSSNATIRAYFLPNSATFGGEVGKLSLKNDGAFRIRLQISRLAQNGATSRVQTHTSGDGYFNNPNTKTVNPIDYGVDDGMLIRVYSEVQAGTNREGAEYFIYRSGNPYTAKYRHTGTTLIGNTLRFEGVN